MSGYGYIDDGKGSILKFTKKVFMKIFIKLILLIIVAFLIYLFFPRDSDRLIYIPKKSDRYAMESISYQDTPINSFDYSLLKLFDFKDGWIRVESRTNLYKIFKKILKGSREKSRKMVMYGGESIEDFSKKIAKQANLGSSKVLKKYRDIAYYSEGDITAKRYNIPYETTESSTIAYMVYRGHNIYRDILKGSGVKFPSKEFKRYLIIASIIEKETQNYDEMPFISAVIHNRLNKNMRLQFDATLNYGKNRHRVITPYIIKSDNSRYNTYKYKGLPPEPLCSPSVVAFKAALYPAAVDYLYFVKSGERHKFSKDYKSHIKRVSIYKRDVRSRIAQRVKRVINGGVKVDFPEFKPKFNFNLPIK